MALNPVRSQFMNGGGNLHALVGREEWIILNGLHARIHLITRSDERFRQSRSDQSQNRCIVLRADAHATTQQNNWSGVAANVDEPEGWRHDHAKNSGGPYSVEVVQNRFR